MVETTFTTKEAAAGATGHGDRQQRERGGELGGGKR